jgi:hypothetical protein
MPGEHTISKLLGIYGNSWTKNIAYLAIMTTAGPGGMVEGLWEARSGVGPRRWRNGLQPNPYALMQSGVKRGLKERDGVLVRSLRIERGAVRQERGW